MVLVLCSSPEKCFMFVPDFVKISQGFGSSCANTISIVKFAKGHNSVKM